MRVEDLGLVPYLDALALQERRLAEVADGAEETLFLLEHPKVITLGRNGGGEHLLAGREALARMGVELVQSSRGGSITCHFPGQLVAYPIFRVDRRPGGLRRFVHDVEEAIIRALSCLGIAAERVEGRPGVFVGRQAKIASIGMAVRRWTTYHGLALNVGPDVSLFNLITMCGLPDVRPTSVQLQQGAGGDRMPEVKDGLVREFRALFGR